MTPSQSTPIPDGSVIITPTEVYAEVRATHDEVKSVSSKLDALPVHDLVQQLGDHESRLRILERSRWPLPTLGVLAGVGGAVTGAIALFIR
ncbi:MULTISPECIES: hypothetical protein [unclassified Streptomyces]|uniref:hypothetical protein n=1 Tax=unclassified Streptomyces TaxID=2593676 RepID=UPI00278BF98F|nr:MULTISPECIES: hypothetical protein [unclassified Streptomyces]